MDQRWNGATSSLAAVLQYLFSCRLGRRDKTIESEIDSPQAKKYLNMMLLEYGTTLAFLEQYLDSLHSDFKRLIKKMPQ